MDGVLPDEAHAAAPIDERTPPSMAILRALESLGVDVSGKAWTLHDYVDPDALDGLFREGLSSDGDRTGMVTLEVADHFVEVTPDEVVVYGTSRTTSPTRSGRSTPTDD